MARNASSFGTNVMTDVRPAFSESDTEQLPRGWDAHWSGTPTRARIYLVNVHTSAAHLQDKHPNFVEICSPLSSRHTM